MGGLALIARSAGHTVTGCDAGVYPPMSTQLREQGIQLVEGYGAEQLSLKPDLFVIGNVVSRGNPLMEAILEQGLPYVSGPQWLGEQVLRGQHVLAVAGTHGKTTTSSMLAWILEYAGLAPNFLIGGVAPGLKVSARLNPGQRHFVIEADEYDTAFFDKRSKFVHYRPRTAILNNLEYDHADIFPDLAAIETQFHHLLRTVPASGLVLRPTQSEALDPCSISARAANGRRAPCLTVWALRYMPTQAPAGRLGHKPACRPLPRRRICPKPACGTRARYAGRLPANTTG
jgi:UDP-N-acetylmuramate: L-alanyl-gamma-D-glutamyl-meso-diaminopimelate ligase